MTRAKYLELIEKYKTFEKLRTLFKLNYHINLLWHAFCNCSRHMYTSAAATMRSRFFFELEFSAEKNNHSMYSINQLQNAPVLRSGFKWDIMKLNRWH